MASSRRIGHYGPVNDRPRRSRTSFRALIVALGLFVAVPTAVLATEFPAGFTGYHSYTEIAAETAAVAAAHPDIAQRFSIGKSHQGREMWAMKISDNVATDETEPEVLFDGATHADEHMGAEMTLRIMHWLVDGYGTDTRITNIVNSREVWIVFVVNPDGAEYDISGGKFHFWRKNRQPTSGHRLHRDGPQPELRLPLGHRGQHQHEPRRHHLPRPIRVLRARRPEPCATSWPAGSSTDASRSERPSRSTNTGAWSCGRTATPTRMSRPT